jgi:hypothetical protein
MRQLISVVVALGLPALAAAQSAPPAPSLQPHTRNSSFSLPPIGLPLPPIGLPLPSLGLPPLPGDARQGLPGHPPPGDGRHGRNHDRRPHPVPTVVYFGTFYPWSGDPPPAPGIGAPTAAAATEEPVVGYLRLDVQPADALQLFVDGVYVGTSDDVSAELAINPGVRRIEIRADGYDTLIFDARIVAGRTITYRGSLIRMSPESAAATSGEPASPGHDVRPESRTIYFIPSCYLGNVPPGDVKLPPGCDPSRVIVRTP